MTIIRTAAASPENIGVEPEREAEQGDEQADRREGNRKAAGQRRRAQPVLAGGGGRAPSARAEGRRARAATGRLPGMQSQRSPCVMPPPDQSARRISSSIALRSVMATARPVSFAPLKVISVDCRLTRSAFSASFWLSKSRAKISRSLNSGCLRDLADDGVLLAAGRAPGREDLDEDRLALRLRLLERLHFEWPALLRGSGRKSEWRRAQMRRRSSQTAMHRHKTKPSGM